MTQRNRNISLTMIERYQKHAHTCATGSFDTKVVTIDQAVDEAGQLSTGMA